MLMRLAGTEAKLLDSLVNRTIPMWWDDIDNLIVLEKLTILLFNKVCIYYVLFKTGVGVFRMKIRNTAGVLIKCRFKNISK